MPVSVWLIAAGPVLVPPDSDSAPPDIISSIVPATDPPGALSVSCVDPPIVTLPEVMIVTPVPFSRYWLVTLMSPFTRSIQHVEPWLTLQGLRTIFEKNQPS